MTDTKIKEGIIRETKKCASDIVYFIKTYCKVRNESDGIVPFDLYRFQEDTLEDIHRNSRTMILKSRQLGLSSLLAVYSLWTCLFSSGKSVVVISTTEKTAQEFIRKVRLANSKLPPWMKLETLENSRKEIRFSNNSSIMALSSASNAARSFSASLLILDEAAFIESIADVWTAAQPVLSSVKNGKVIVLSTPNGSGNWFHTMWVDSTNGFNKVILDWSLHPDRDEVWKIKQIEDLGIRKFSQEFGCSFLMSGGTLIDGVIIKYYEDNVVKEPLEKRRAESIWVWELPRLDERYIIAVDVARGDGSDFSAFNVIKCDTLEIVADYKEKIDPRSLASIVTSVATEYNHGLLIVERNGQGYNTLQSIVDFGYPNLYYSSNDLKIVDLQKDLSNLDRLRGEDDKLKAGIETSTTTRALFINRLEEVIRKKRLKAYSSRLLSELKTFIWKGGRATAADGFNDDLIMSLAIGLWVESTNLRRATTLFPIIGSNSTSHTPVYVG